MWMLAYKPGRTVAMPNQFDTKKQAQACIDAGVVLKGKVYPFDGLHAVETDGQIKVTRNLLERTI